MALLTIYRFRMLLLNCIVFILFLIPYLRRDQPVLFRSSTSPDRPLSQRLDLTEDQCRTAFPLQYTALDASISKGPFKFYPSPAEYKGLVQARIKNNHLFILTTAPDNLPQILHQRTSTLSQIHRALLTSPTPLPDTYFSFTINDVPKNDSWGFAAPNKLSGENVWIMPNFAGWSWPKARVGSMDETLTRIAFVEEEVGGWDYKEDKLVWRGTPWFNPLGHPHLRKDLLAKTKGKEWADVAALDASTALKIEDFCRYKYIVYTEGVTYSGRLPYHQACENVLITAPLTWVTTSAVLMRPIWVEEFMGEGAKRRVGEGALPTVKGYEDANAIYVNSDFANLEKLIGFLRTHPHVARRIARNQRNDVAKGEYLSLAAETCYWRALIRGWHSVATVDEEDWRGLEGERYETWLLKEVSMTRGEPRGRTMNI